MRQSLTPAQKVVYEAMRDYVALNGMSPTLDELTAITGRVRSTISEHLNTLVARGYITKGYGNRRYGIVGENDFNFFVIENEIKKLGLFEKERESIITTIKEEIRRYATRTEPYIL